MLSADEIMLRIKEHRKEIRKFGVKKLALFGSYARGEAKKNSDVDFLVVFEKKRGGYDDYVGLLELLRKVLDKKIDLVKPKLIREELRDSILGGIKVEAEI